MTALPWTFPGYFDRLSVSPVSLLGLHVVVSMLFHCWNHLTVLNCHAHVSTTLDCTKKTNKGDNIIIIPRQHANCMIVTRISKINSETNVLRVSFIRYYSSVYSNIGFAVKEIISRSVIFSSEVITNCLYLTCKLHS